MSKYKFRADEAISIYASMGARCIMVELDMTTPQTKEAFLALAGGCRLNELGDWMEELGYTIKEIESE